MNDSSKINISVCIITKNEERKIGKCLASVLFASEVIVVDDYSDDRTVEICKEFDNVTVYSRKFDGFGMQKSYAVSLAKEEWVLNIDADEEVASELREELRLIVEGGSRCSGYTVRRNNYNFGKFLLDDYPGPLRLFKKASGNFEKVFVHEHVEVEGDIGQLEGVLTHRPFSTESYDNYYKIYVEKYGRLAAFDYAKRGQRVTKVNFVWKLFLIPVLVFIREYFVKKKCFQGYQGMYLSYCNSMCYHLAYKYLMDMSDD